MRVSGVCGLLLICGALVACGEPPDKELGQAQGAIDAARAAGADRYATAELGAATEALRKAQEAVTAGDYRVALGGALDSREHAENAAREAADTRARLRSDVERLLSEVTAARAEAEKGIGPRRRRRAGNQEPQAVLSRASKDLQEASALVVEGDYQAATQALTAAKERLDALNAALQSEPPAQTPRRRR